MIGSVFNVDSHDEKNFSKLVHILTPPTLEEVLERIVRHDEMALLSPQTTEFDRGCCLPQGATQSPSMLV